jgi:hypothetical protein
LTKGEKPAVFSRGNHDLRGNFAEKFAAYTPTDSGNTYYSFRLGNIWGILLDCGEDKNDDHPEYGFTVACHTFRERQTEFLKDIIKNSENEYEAHGVKHKLVISHNAFVHRYNPPFDIEQELYGEWCKLLRDHIKPELLIFGHNHATKVLPVGCELDHQGQPCPALIGSRPFTPNKDRPEEHFHGCAVELNGEHIRVVFNTDTGEIIEDTVL